MCGPLSISTQLLPGAADQRPMHRSGVSLPPLLGLVLVLGMTGCARPGSLEVPRCPNPVLLGPIDRVGGHRATAANSTNVTGRIRANVTDYVAKPSAEDEELSDLLGSRPSNAARALTVQVLNATGGRADRDVRVDSIEAGALVMFVIPFVAMSHSTKLDAKVVEVRK